MQSYNKTIEEVGTHTFEDLETVYAYGQSPQTGGSNLRIRFRTIPQQLRVNVASNQASWRLLIQCGTVKESAQTYPGSHPMFDMLLHSPPWCRSQTAHSS